MSLSEKRIGILTKQALGHTVKGLIQQRILLEAKRLINQGNLSFKSIAFQLGFVDASYFSRFFKKYSGITPEQFKSTLG
ncbi:MAG: helix-turn-helix domain-containing protein [Dysgonomonas sp.]|nr:helix-turn-helix domain-containing protein [Dysgonomonas sp.]